MSGRAYRLKRAVGAEMSVHSPDDYRRAAKESRRLADHAADKWERDSLLRIAADWERLSQFAQQAVKPVNPVFKTGR